MSDNTTPDIGNTQTRIRFYIGLDGAERNHQNPKNFVRTYFDRIFPAGYTLIEGEGRWVGDHGTPVNEETIIIENVGRELNADNIQSIVDELKQELNQEAIGIQIDEVENAFL